MTVVKAICRLVRKFNGQIKSSVKKSVIEVIAKGLTEYSHFYEKWQPHKAKQAQLILSMLKPEEK